ncbi:putative porin POR2 KNAG_0E01870 [Huiozyma naganishii CBS 8797]|uniref:Mitochondrial outer membrane protein porin n=1 Tax=Huiozyma naganishii (strain ATCC MYA-139 / BCRC 22969 / CBS 8797 / KCTC 17520 / NBRC 10181 / NCYC 3082 / Yp74L-3) TaxID=1071383 RepID=J7S6K7_HUIN7|nr:hypothetical protein KNAG_0E01870 [Kazachstania naganishii CBS 8797]CCK70449.1 hypothetical protein KNAG_0E01870 [Kazachstania naganishii CBS 8797]
MPPFFPDISRDINSLLNRDFFHGAPLNVAVRTQTQNGAKFTVQAKQSAAREGAVAPNTPATAPTMPTAGPLLANIQGRWTDKASGVTVTPTWTTANQLTTRVELRKWVPGVTTELVARAAPGSRDPLPTLNVLSVSLLRPSVAAKLAARNISAGAASLGVQLTVSHEKFLTGGELHYDVAKGRVSRYAVALAYVGRGHTLTVSINDSQLTTASLFQRVSRDLDVGLRTTLNAGKLAPQSSTLQLAAKYKPDSTSQVKAKIADTGKMSVSYCQDLKPGVTLGCGASLDTLHWDAQTVHKVGWSLTFNL